MRSKSKLTELDELQVRIFKKQQEVEDSLDKIDKLNHEIAKDKEVFNNLSFNQANDIDENGAVDRSFNLSLLDQRLVNIENKLERLLPTEVENTADIAMDPKLDNELRVDASQERTGLPSCEVPDWYDYNPFTYPLRKGISSIHGEGVFATHILGNLIEQNLGPTHIVLKIEDGEVTEGTTSFRTPLGAYLNHSENPNCKIELIQDWGHGEGQIFIFCLIPLMVIVPGTELTVNYEDNKHICGVNSAH